MQARVLAFRILVLVAALAFSTVSAAGTAPLFHYGPYRLYPGAVYPSPVITDWNEDGFPDVVTTDGWFPGNGDRSFQTKHSFGVAGVWAALRVLDLDGDGHLDVLGALRDYDPDFAVLFGAGTGG